MKQLWLLRQDMKAGASGGPRKTWGIECADRTQAAEKPIAEELARVWAQEELAKEDRRVDWQKFMPPRGYVALPRRWVLERSFSNGFLRTEEDEPMDYERLCASAEAFIYAAMIRLMVRRLAHR
jgi:transposase